jgi:colanic acid biosynthesis glycosyl transferase WcaI
MACGRPVVACTDADSDLAQLVAQAQGGVVVPPADTAALAKAILHAFQNRAAWLAKGLTARELILTGYSRPAISREYHQLIMELTGRNDDASRKER